MLHSVTTRIGKLAGLRAGRRKRGLTVAAAVLAATAVAATLTSPAEAVRAGDLDARGFPVDFTDSSGLTLAMCEDGTARCSAATEADLVAPEGENFYWMATTTIPTDRGPIDVEFAQEAAFNVDQPIVFDRMRVRGHVTRAGKYTLLHPYGRTTVTADSPANPRNLNFTSDRECGALTANMLCDRRITNFLHARTSSVGYIGNPNTPTLVAGSPLRNKIIVLFGGKVIGQTKRFAIQGKLNGPAAMLPTALIDFGKATQAKTKSITIRNPGTEALTISSLTVAGSNAINKVNTSTCRSGANVASGGSCVLTMRYRPGLARGAASKATITIRDNTPAGVHRLPVQARKR